MNLEVTLKNKYMKGIILQLFLLISLTAFSEVMSEKDIQNIAHQTNSQIQGVDIGDGIISKGCTSEGRTLIFKYEVPNNWEPYDQLKENLLVDIKGSTQFAQLCFTKNIDVDYVFLKQNSLVKKISFKSYEFYTDNYISIKDHPKAKGVNFKIKVPIGWEVTEGITPNAVKILTNMIFPNSSYNIVINNNITFFSRQQAYKILQDNIIKYKNEVEEYTTLHYKEPQVIEQSLVKISTYPAVLFKVKAKSLDSPHRNVILKQWIILYEDKVITLLGMGEDDLYFKTILEKEFNYITNSIIFPEQFY